MLRNLVNYIWAIVWGIFMLLLMGLPSVDIPGVGVFDGFDKMSHCGFFFVFTALFLLGSMSQPAGNPSKIKAVVISFFFASILAFGTEAIQYYLSTGRQADWWDIFADYVGIGQDHSSYIWFYRSGVA